MSVEGWQAGAEDYDSDAPPAAPAASQPTPDGTPGGTPVSRRSETAKKSWADPDVRARREEGRKKAIEVRQEAEREVKAKRLQETRPFWVRVRMEGFESKGVLMKYASSWAGLAAEVEQVTKTRVAEFRANRSSIAGTVLEDSATLMAYATSNAQGLVPEVTAVRQFDKQGVPMPTTKAARATQRLHDMVDPLTRNMERKAPKPGCFTKDDEEKLLGHIRQKLGVGEEADIGVVVLNVWTVSGPGSRNACAQIYLGMQLPSKFDQSADSYMQHLAQCKSCENATVDLFVGNEELQGKVQGAIAEARVKHETVKKRKRELGRTAVETRQAETERVTQQLAKTKRLRQASILSAFQAGASDQ
eukprot:TRINITY_DN40921_c0_g1_i1.p1 TRINITY_DN40921_c0_g1~~TRINITY_DN40921_c0_g1_i1.p1  ORF type:complete len:388 (+),score=91.65 TRINITY_DN40921_c0_g1_i1:85-1164(+)